MSARGWKERAWKLAFYAALLAATWGLLTPSPPAIGEGIPFVDKLQHVVLFAALALLGTRAYADRPRWGIVAALVFYGACIEIAQLRSGRSFELLDILADAVGALAVYLAPRRSVVTTARDAPR